MLARRRNPCGEWASLIDSLILTIGLGLISWLVLISPVIHDDSQGSWPGSSRSPTPRPTSCCWPARCGWRSTPASAQPAFYLLFGSIVRCLSTDFIYGVLLINGTYNGQVLLDIGWICYYLLLGRGRPAPVDAHAGGAGAREGDEAVMARGWWC